MARQSKMMMLSGKIIFWTNISSWLTYKTSSNGTGGETGNNIIHFARYTEKKEILASIYQEDLHYNFGNTPDTFLND